MRYDLSLPGTDLPEGWEPEPKSQLDRHPYVRRLRRENAALRSANQRYQDLHTEMVARDLLAARHLEPLNPAPPGVIEPLNGQPTIVHVDTYRLMKNRVMGERAPTIRLLVGGLSAAPLHCHAVSLGPSDLAERYREPLPGRPGAIAVLHTIHPVTVVL